MVRSMLSESLRAVISQTLLKRTGGGRVAAHEIMIGTPAIRNLIREGKIAQMYSSIQTGQSRGHADARPVPDRDGREGLGQQGRGALQGAEQGRAVVAATGVTGSGTSEQLRTRVMDRDQGIKLMQELLKRVVERKASDLFITANFPPAIKIDGEIRPQMERALTPEQSAHAGARHHERSPDQGIRRHQGMQFRDRAARHRPLSRQRLRAAGPRRLRDPPDQRQDPHLRGAGPAADPEGSGAVQARPGDRGRRHRLGQVDHAGLDARLPQRQDPRPHRHHRGSGRVRAPAQGLRDHPPRGRASTPIPGTPRSRTRCARRPT